ncbi:uncharacterized protein LOC135488035 isoform X2 [Lineus longissimus]|uniref:uncharacterized protein LOC135488035 isoform X2 n=1 Tax=Lineus longissimus TaxID=88925 RepID=UPI00315CA0BE
MTATSIGPVTNSTGNYRSDFMGQSEVPPWIIVVIVVVILLILLGISVFLVMKFKMKLRELCRGCKFKDTQRTKKNRFGARDGSTRSSKSLILPPRIPIQQGYEKPPPMIDIEYSRRRSMMDRFFSSIAAHPPTYGIDEMEPLRPSKPERTKSKPPEKREIRRSLDTVGRDTDRDSEKKQFIVEKYNKEDSLCDICVKGPSDDNKMSHDSGSTTVDIKHAPSDTIILKKNEVPVNSSLHSLNGWVDHNPHLPRDLTTPLDRPVPSLPILYALTRTSNPSSGNSKTSLNTASVKGSADNVTRGYPQTTV